MADEAIISTAEEIAGQEGSVATLENATPEVEQPRLVPERDLMAVKDKAQRQKAELEARIAELEARIPKNTSALASKYEGVDADFLADIEALVEKKANEKIAPLLSQSQSEKQEKALEKLMDSRLAVAEIDQSKVDRELLKTLALTPKYRNVDIKDLAEMLYKTEPTGRATTENETRPAVDLDKGPIDFESLSKDDIDKNWKNEKFRKAYLNHITG